MPPASLNSPRTVDTGHMLAPHEKRSNIGPTAGIIVILVLIVLGALYFWGAYLNQKNSVDQLPFITEETESPI